MGGGEAWWASGHGERTIVSLSKCREPDPGDPREKELVDVAGEMALAAGLPSPDVLILRDRDPNAFSVASAGSNGTILVTWGLVQELNREELQAVVAHEMSHLRNRDAQVMTLLSVLFGSVTVIATWARRGGTLTIGRASSLLLAPVWILFGLLSLLISRLLGLAVSREREYLADASAVELTRNPNALISALTKIEADGLPTWNIVRGCRTPVHRRPARKARQQIRNLVVRSLFNPPSDAETDHAPEGDGVQRSPPRHSPTTSNITSRVRGRLSKSTSRICCQVPSRSRPSETGTESDGPRSAART